MAGLAIKNRLLPSTLHLPSAGITGKHHWSPAAELQTSEFPGTSILGLSDVEGSTPTLAGTRLPPQGTLLCSPARFVPVGLQACLDLIVGEEGHVARVVDSQELPIPQ